MIPRVTGALLLGCLLAVGLSGTALGHAELVESDPAAGATIETPYRLTATFSEPLTGEGSNIVVRDGAGREVARGGVGEDPEMMVVELPTLPAGEYVARWTAVTPDDMGVTRGTIDFRVDVLTHTPRPTASASPTLAPSPSPSPPVDDEPTAGVADVLFAVALAGAIIVGLAIYLFRRR